MKVKLLKSHKLGSIESEHDVDPALANYLVRCKVAEYCDLVIKDTDQKPNKKVKLNIEKE